MLWRFAWACLDYTKWAILIGIFLFKFLEWCVFLCSFELTFFFLVLQVVSSRECRESFSCSANPSSSLKTRGLWQDYHSCSLPHCSLLCFALLYSLHLIPLSPLIPSSAPFAAKCCQILLLLLLASCVATLASSITCLLTMSARSLTDHVKSIASEGFSVTEQQRGTRLFRWLMHRWRCGQWMLSVWVVFSGQQLHLWKKSKTRAAAAEEERRRRRRRRRRREREQEQDKTREEEEKEQDKSSQEQKKKERKSKTRAASEEEEREEEQDKSRRKRGTARQEQKKKERKSIRARQDRGAMEQRNSVRSAESRAVFSSVTPWNGKENSAIPGVDELGSASLRAVKWKCSSVLCGSKKEWQLCVSS